jgi:drug/metabolite transporter (DMT)-like permease
MRSRSVVSSVISQAGPAPYVVVAVIFAAVLHATWNAIAHRIPDQALGFALIGIACALGGAAMLPWVATPSRRAWAFLAASAALHVFYTVFLARSYRIGEFSQVYPIARGTSPLVVSVITVTVLGQPLGLRQAAGVLVISSGLLVLCFGGQHISHVDRPALQAAVATGLLIAAYTIVDGTGVRHADSTGGYIAWLFLLQGPVIAFVMLRSRRRTLAEVRPFVAVGLFSGLVSLIAYGIVIWAQTQSNLATVSALREMSILFGALIGVLFFRERFGVWRVTGAALAVAGVLLIAT